MIRSKTQLTKPWRLVKSSALLAVLAMGLLTSCVGNGSSSSQDDSKNLSQQGNINSKVSLKPIQDDFFLITMGSGYDLVTNKATSGQSCLVNASIPGNVIVSNPTASFNFEQDEDIRTLQNELNVDVTGSGGGDRFSGSISGSFANASKDNSYSTNLVYLYKYAGTATFKSLGQGESALTKAAAAMIEQPTALRQMCGNSYVSQMSAGALLAVNLKLSFNSHSDKQSFDAKMSASGGLAGVAAEIQQAASSANVHVSISLSAIQQGGEPEKLNELFGESNTKGNYPIVDCGNGIGESNACNLMVSNVITYAKNIENQLSNGHGGIDMDKLYYSKPVVDDYSSLGIPTHGAPDPSADILSAMQLLTTQYDKALYDYTFVTHYSNVLRYQLDPGVADYLDDMADKLNNQITNVFTLPAYRVTDCYRGYVSTDCLRIKDNVENAISRYALSDVENHLLSYLESSSYSATLINYYGESTPSSANYQKTSCILAPIGSWLDENYAINCDGKWLAVRGSGINIMPGFGGEGIDIKNMVYFSQLGDGQYGQWISYTDFFLPQDFALPNTFKGDTDIIAPEYSNKDSQVEVVNNHSNQA